MKSIESHHKKKVSGLYIDPVLEKKYKGVVFQEKLKKANEDLVNSNFTDFIKKETL